MWCVCVCGVCIGVCVCWCIVRCVFLYVWFACVCVCGVCACVVCIGECVFGGLVCGFFLISIEHAPLHLYYYMLSLMYSITTFTRLPIHHPFYHSIVQ